MFPAPTMSLKAGFVYREWEQLQWAFTTLVEGLVRSTHCCCSEGWDPAAARLCVCTSAERGHVGVQGACWGAQRPPGLPERGWTQPGSCVRPGTHSRHMSTQPLHLFVPRSHIQRLQKQEGTRPQVIIENTGYWSDPRLTTGMEQRMQASRTLVYNWHVISTSCWRE